MKTTVYKIKSKLAGMASAYDYLIKKPHCVEQIMEYDYIIPHKDISLIHDGNLLRFKGCIFDLDTETLKVLVEI